MTKPVAIVILGPQGSGKSTQAEYLSKRYRLPLFQSGAESRKFAEGSSQEAQTLKDLLKKGKLTPYYLMEKLLRNFLTTNDVSRGVIFDGFPRSLKQTELFQDLATEFGWDVVGVFIDISEATTFKRLAKRVVIKNDKVVPREDDNPVSIRQRLEIYRKETLPVLNWLERRYRLLRVDGEPSIEEITEEVISKLKETTILD